MLFSLHATGELRVLDLYAGCGALGIESGRLYRERTQDYVLIESIGSKIASSARASTAVVAL